MDRRVIEETLARAGLEPIEPFEPLPRRKRDRGQKRDRVIEEVLTSVGLEPVECEDKVEEKSGKRLRRAV
ncbi:hypothetical protein [Syntrophothermus lipocalidus]|uniref:Uncharacterized protein n=1 Tax=Syntrophothermus lipocalidus (strain DSM 12680 / TGB-C1) TaxID=643648 RepID=D7CK43_SYNLT|nr:hypothetical protein [Syntrophothermus lipocalidus]ADI01157.1 hypothetical protein Slip_0373 [Syntrophothermus lipocalidus DSM 12680]